jgi:hypothetical protein
MILITNEILDKEYSRFPAFPRHIFVLENPTKFLGISVQGSEEGKILY